MIGCGHLFHIECLIPETSTCPLCEQTIANSLEELSGKANNAVFYLKGEGGTDDQDSNGESETTSGEEDFDEKDEVEVMDGSRFSTMINRIWSWQRPAVDML